MKQILSRQWLWGLILITIVGLLCYGWLVPWLGFYYDDWTFAWIAHRLRPAELISAFKPFRPFLGPSFFITTTILGESPFLWHLFNLMVRVILAFVLWWSFKQIWPNRSRQMIWVALLFLVYPGFSQQWVSLTHSNQELIPHCFQILSLGLMAKHVRHPQSSRRLLPLSLGLTLLGIFSTEYFLSLELLRPVIIWIILREDDSSKKNLFKKLLQHWLPYLLILIANIIWLIAYQGSATYQSYRISIFNQLKASPLEFALATLQNFINSFSLAALEVWGRLLSVFKNPLNALSTYLIFGVVMVACITLWLAFIKMHLADNQEDVQNKPRNNHWAIQAILIGGFAIFLGRLPSWGVGLPLVTDFPFDRLMMPVMLGSSLFLVGLIELMIIADRRKTLFLILLVSLAVGTQFSYSNTYRRDWEQQKDFFQQLNWRAPALQPGTLLITHELPMKYVTDNSLSAAINWIYDPVNRTREMRYMLVYSKARMGSPLLPDLQPDSKIEYAYRTLNFSSRVGQALVIYYPTDGCLRILDPLFTNKEFFPDAPYQLTDAINLSNLELIKFETSPVTLPPIIGSELEHGWCYYFQKAELARQKGGWQQVVDLLDRAENLNLKAKNPSEYLVFVEGLIRMGNMERAQTLAIAQLLSSGKTINGACDTLKRVKASMSNNANADLDALIVKLNCLTT